MGFLGFLTFAFKCIQLLAWPLFALGYPRCASIRAIETNSKDQMRKLITYWIILSLISVFELAFVKIVEWLPFWPCMKITVICCLVFPRFTGAKYAYKWTIRPLLSVNLVQRLHAIINSLNEKDKSSLKTETFLTVAERYINNNGTESLEKLITRKTKIAAEHFNVEKMRAVAAREQNEVSSVIEKFGTKVDVKEMTSRSTVRDYVPPVPPALSIQKEWTCAVCQVKTLSEIDLNSHLQVRKHKSKCEELKANKQRVNKNSSSSSTASNKANQDPKKTVSDDGQLNRNISQKGKQMQFYVNNELWSAFVEQEGKLMQREHCNYQCGMCNVACPNEIAMAEHLNGRKHLKNMSQIKSPTYGHGF